VQHKMQQSPRHEAIEGAGQARVQTVSRAVAAAAGVGVHAQREGGDVQEETVFARCCWGCEARARGSVERREQREVVTARKQYSAYSCLFSLYCHPKVFAPVNPHGNFSEVICQSTIVLFGFDKFICGLTRANSTG